MKKFATWPDPPFSETLEPPQIPESLTIFGKLYDVKDNRPVIKHFDTDTELCHNYVQENLQKSCNLFKSIIEDLSLGRDVTNKVLELSNLHEIANLYFNECRVKEAEGLIKKERTEFMKKKSNIKDQIENIINKNK